MGSGERSVKINPALDQVVPEGVMGTLPGLLAKFQRDGDSSRCAHRGYVTGLMYSRHPVRAIWMLVLSQGNAPKQAFSSWVPLRELHTGDLLGNE